MRLGADVALSPGEGRTDDLIDRHDWAVTTFFERRDVEFPLGVVGTTFLVVVLGICVGDSIERVIKYRRIRNQVSRRGPAAESI